MVRCIIWCAVSSQAQNEPDKVSLPQQEADSRAVAERNGWEIVEVLKVPGHSRRYIDFHQLAKDAAKQGVDAFYHLQRHWETRDFDVMIVRDGDRFARTQALHAYVVERTIDIRARIYSLQDGWIDDTNYRMWIAMGGYKAAGDIDRLVKARDVAMTARAKRGLPTSSRVPVSHQVVRDTLTGRAICLEVNEAKRRLWDDLAELILEGVGWFNIENELYDRFGHVNDNGEKYYPGFMYRLITKPIFWGHIGRNHASAKSKNGFKVGLWVYDEREPIPEGATIFRDTHPAVYTGELADRIKAELRRRSEVVRGHASSSNTHRFSGLGVCAQCGSFWATKVDKGYRAVFCPAVRSSRTFSPDCNNTKHLNERRLIEQVNELLKQMLARESTDIFNDAKEEQTQDITQKVAQLNEEIATLELEARRLIRQQAKAGAEIQQIYQEELEQIDSRLSNMKSARDTLALKTMAAQKSSLTQQVTLDELAQLSLEAFWKKESRYINQVLHRLMGKKRFLLLDGEIIGVAEVNRKQRSHA